MYDLYSLHIHKIHGLQKKEEENDKKQLVIIRNLFFSSLAFLYL